MPTALEWASGKTGVDRRSEKTWLPLNDLGELMHTNVYLGKKIRVRRGEKKDEMREGVFADVHLLRTNQEGPSPAKK